VCKPELVPRLLEQLHHSWVVEPSRDASPTTKKRCSPLLGDRRWLVVADGRSRDEVGAGAFVALLQRFIPFRCARGPLPVPLTSSCDRSKLSSVLSSVLSSKIYILKEYFLSFTTCTLFYSTLFLNSLCFSYYKSIIYINYYPYLIIFHTNNFFSLIPISTTIHSFI
jgi:hypothetical protein